MIERSALKLGCLNIGGNAKLKCTTDDIQKIIKQHDVIAIVESWLDPKERIPRVDGYINFRSDRKKQSRAKRASGGLNVYCKSTLAGGITKCASKQNDVMWIKLDQIYFGLEKDLYICMTYIPPESSTYYEAHNSDFDHFDILSREIEHYSSLGEITLMRDLNSRIGLRNEEHYDVRPDTPGTDITRPLHVPTRASRDTRVNGYGRKLLQLMNTYNLMVTNGRVCGDLAGEFTCCQWHGLSVVDKLIIDQYYRDWIISKLKILTGIVTMHLYPSHWKWRWWNHILCWEPGTKSFQVWNDETKQKFKQALQAPDIQSLLDDFTNCNHADANTATLKFTDILQLAIHKVFPKRVRSAYKTSVKRKTRYSQECQLAKRAFKKAQQQFKVDKGNLNRRQIFVREKRKYKKFLYAFIKYSKLKSIYDINDLEKGF